MARQFANIAFATLIIIATSGTLHAQRGGGFRGHAGGPGRPSPAPSAPIPSVPRSTFSGHALPPVVSPFSPRIGIGARVGVIRPQPRVIFPQPFVGFYSPYLWNPPIYTAPAYVDPTYAAPTYSAPAVSQNEAELSYQVQRLSQEIEQLRQEQSLAASRQAPPPPPSPDTVMPTILVFRDGHRMTISNYAIVGQTLWVLDEKTSMKISLSDLDLDATERENRGQGVRFAVPKR